MGAMEARDEARRERRWLREQMNVEKTMPFILDMQAKGEERWVKADGRLARFDKTIEFILDNQAKTEERFAKA